MVIVLLPDKKFVSTWDLVEGSLCRAFSLVVVYVCDAQCCQVWGIYKGTRVQLFNMWDDMATRHSTPIGFTSW